MSDVAATREGSTLAARCPVVVMDPTRASTIAPDDAAVLLQSFVCAGSARSAAARPTR